MKMPLQEEMLGLLKQKLLPELAEIRKEQAAGRERELRMQADLTVIAGRIDQVEKHIVQVEEEIRELKSDLRELRSYIFTSYVTGKQPYGAVREKPGK